MKKEQRNWPDYEVFDHHLFVASTPFSAAYIHGMIVGLLSTGLYSVDVLKAMLQKEFPELEKRGSANELFNALLESSDAALKDSNKTLKLLLPNDEENLSARISALSEWSEGFLMGLSKSNMLEQLKHNELANEALTDIGQVISVNHEIDETEENEKYYNEVIEFIKVSVLLIHEQAKQTHETVKQLH